VDLLFGCHSAILAALLPARLLGSLRVADRTAHSEFTPAATALCRSALDHVVPDAAVREHYRGILGPLDSPMLLMSRRRWLLAVDEATQFSQWRTETAVARLMNGVSMDGGDLFAALKRSFLASQVPNLASSPIVVRWMHVLGAVEEQDPVQAKLLAAEAWTELAGTVDGESLVWVLQAAHFVDSLSDIGSWLLDDGRHEASTLLAWLQALERMLKETPSAGRYGPAGDSSQLRARHVSAVVRDVTARLAHR